MTTQILTDFEGLCLKQPSTFVVVLLELQKLPEHKFPGVGCPMPRVMLVYKARHRDVSCCSRDDLAPVVDDITGARDSEGSAIS